MGTREQKSKIEGNKGTKANFRKREQEIKILILSNKGKCRFISGNKEIGTPLGGPR